MPADTLRRSAQPAVPHPSLSDFGGWVEINPRFAALGLTTPAAFLDLPGEVVCGHPDRHVVRVELSRWPNALYLKRQHRITGRERLRQWLAGFGWSSRCTREGRLLYELEAAGFPCPSCVAFGEDGRGRAFLLVEELAGAAELRRLLGDTGLSLETRLRLADRLGQAVAELHAAGFATPDLTAKHVFVNRPSHAVTLIDWQSARRVARLDSAERWQALAALHASLADGLANRRERLRFLWAYLRVSRRTGFDAPRFARVVAELERLAAKAAERRSIRDQRQPAVTRGAEQRLVWLAGEAVCAVPDVAAVWPSPAITAPFYDTTTTPLRIRLADGRPAELVRFPVANRLGRLIARVRGRAWRFPGATLGRVLFHLQRYGIAAPRLLAFGQREAGDSFALYEPPAGVPLERWLAQAPSPAARHEVLRQVEALFGQLCDADCLATGREPLFWVAEEPALRVSVGGVGSVRIVRRLSARRRRQDLAAIRALFLGGWSDNS